MRLSKTAWNNVIIFSVMSIIIIINYTNNKLFQRDESGAFTQEIPLFSAQAVILTLTINQQFTIERIGQTWRIKPAIIASQPLEQMMYSWQQSTGTTIAIQNELAQYTPIIVSAVIAGEESPYILSLYPLADQLVVYNHNKKRWLTLPLAIFHQLFPNEVLTTLQQG
jgi:hypothetical protein